jgi:membrane protein DedA with SNARE-associated domain
LENFLEHYGYLALLIGTFFEGETAILVASSLIHQGIFDAFPTVIVGFAGSFISDWVYYLIGRLNGKYFVDKRPKLAAKLEPVRSLFRRHQTQVLFSYRFLYGFRVIIPIVIGMSHVTPIRYLFYSVTSGLIWATTVGTVGYFVGRVLKLETSVFEENILFIVIGFATFGILLGYLIRQLAARRLQNAGGPSADDR